MIFFFLTKHNNKNDSSLQGISYANWFFVTKYKLNFPQYTDKNFTFSKKQQIKKPIFFFFL